MKALMKKIDLFCYKHPNFGICNLMLYIVIGNAIVWLFTLMDKSGMLLGWLYFSPAAILRGEVWRLFTFMIIPNSFSYLALIFFYFYYTIGSILERQWGTAKFNIYFFTGIVLTIVYGFVLYFVNRDNIISQLIFINGEYIYLSMFFAFATLYAETQVLLFFIIPIKMKWLAIVDAAFFIYRIAITPFPFNLLPVVAVANYLIFCGQDLLAYFKPARREQRAKAASFRNEVRRMQYEESTRPYRRRCEVCGRTDTDWPDLEFRYCSRCEGYHCYCIDHINNHTHVQ